MKICANCWFVEKTYSTGAPRDKIFWACKAILIGDPVDGVSRAANCAVERVSPEGQCGPDGKLFVDYKERADEINDGEHEKTAPFASVDRTTWEEDYESATE